MEPIKPGVGAQGMNLGIPEERKLLAAVQTKKDTTQLDGFFRVIPVLIP